MTKTPLPLSRRRLLLTTAAASALSLSFPALAANVTLEGFQQTVATAVKNTGTTRVAVTELTEVSGARSNLGLLLTEELTLGLYSAGLKVVERSRVDAILKELNFQYSNLVDTKGTAREVGKIAGVDTIVIGSYTDLLDVIRVNLRIVLVETGEIVAGLSVNLERTKGIVMAMGPTANVATEGSTSFTAETGGRAESVFFKETFDSVREGDVPPGWTGADYLLVKRQGSESYLTGSASAEGLFAFSAGAVPIPGNFRIDIDIEYDRTDFYMVFGGVSVGIYDYGNGNYALIGIDIKSPTYREKAGLSKRRMSLSFMSDRGIVSLLVDQSAIITGRVKIGGLVPPSVAFKVGDRRMGERWEAKVFSIIGYDLG